MLLSVLLVGLPLLCAMTLVCVRTWQGDTLALAALVLMGAAWLRIDKRFEGPLLVEVTRNHGLVAGDLVGLLVLGSGCLGWLLARTVLQPRRADLRD